MLTLMGKARRKRRQDAGSAIMKVARFHGFDEAITTTAEERCADPHCRQVPHGQEVPPTYGVSVVYDVDGDGFVHVYAIDVTFDDGACWTCFFEEGKCEGNPPRREEGDGSQHYLVAADTAEICDLLREYERKRALKRLVKMGPDAFRARRAT